MTRLRLARSIAIAPRSGIPTRRCRRAPPPLPIVRGEGVYLYTEDGRRILDGISSWWVNIHGHSHPRLNAGARASRRASSSTSCLPGCTHRPAVELAERLVALLPRGPDARVLFRQRLDGRRSRR